MTPKTKAGPSPLKIGVFLTGIVALALAIAFATTGSQGESAAVDPYGNPSVTGTALDRFDPRIEDTAVGLPAPVAADLGMDGLSVEVGSPGQPQIIAFLAHWCPHCNAEVPVVVDWVANGGLPSEVALVAVATSTDPGQPNFPPTTWLQERSWPSRVMLDDRASTVAAAYGVSSFPFWVVLDAEGTVLLRTSGELTPAQLDALVQIGTAG